MSFYLGPLYLRDSDIFLFIAIILVLFSIGLGISLPYIGTLPLLLLLILLLSGRAILSVASESTLYTIFIISVIISAIFPFSLGLLFLAISLILLKVTKQLP